MSREPQLQVTEVTLHLKEGHVGPILFDVLWMEMMTLLNEKACETNISWCG